MTDDIKRPPLQTSDPSYHVRETRLQFPPSYAIVGVYRLVTDSNLYRPIWAKVQHGTRRGIIVGFSWCIMTFKIQRAFVHFFLSNSPRVTGLSHDTIFGYKIPFDLVTYATVMFLSSQLNVILMFFLSRNLRIARDRAWELTVQSRGKGPEFWGPYVEEWQKPPQVQPGGRRWHKWVANSAARLVIRKVLLAPLDLYPFVGTLISSWLKAIGTALYLHRPYFASKRMNEHQIAIWMEERKWDYRAFGFIASLLEGVPIVGLGFTISNRIGAAMWAHDLEKRQHMVAAGDLPKLQPRKLELSHEGESIELRPRGTGVGPTKEYAARMPAPDALPGMAGGWGSDGRQEYDTTKLE